MKYSEFIKEIAEKEGLKSQVTVGNIREVVKVIVGILKEKPVATLTLLLGLAKKAK